MEKRLYKILDLPLLYRVARTILAPGAVGNVLAHLEAVLGELPPAKLLLDVGCGPQSLLFNLDLHPVGVDMSMPYVRNYIKAGERAVRASAETLPFPSQSVDAVWSIALFHHLPDSVASQTVKEFVRVCKNPGYVVIMDAVLPESPGRHPIPTLIHRMDRGKFMRSQDDLESLLYHRNDWTVQCFKYTITGLQMAICQLVKT